MHEILHVTPRAFAKNGYVDTFVSSLRLILKNLSGKQAYTVINSLHELASELFNEEQLELREDILQGEHMVFPVF